MKDIVTTASAGIGAAVGFLVGGLDGLMVALLVFMFIDYFSGLVCAVEDRTVSSTKAFRGIVKKLFMIALVCMGHILDTQVIIQIIGKDAVLRTATICWFLSSEGMSIIENTAKMGLPVPEKLQNIFEKLRDAANSNDSSVQPDKDSK